MPGIPALLVIYQADARDALPKLQSILTDLESEGRIARSDFRTADSVTPESLKTYGTGGEFILLVLTEQMLGVKEGLEGPLVRMKEQHPQMRIAEVLVDNVPFEPEFLALPSNLKPVASWQSDDEAWRAIRSDLVNMLPVGKKDKPGWIKKAAIGLGAILLIALVVYALSGVRPVDFTHTALDPVNGFVDEAETCYAPCRIKILSDLGDGETFSWNFGDTVITDERNPVFVYMEPGDRKIVLEVGSGNRKAQTTRDLKIMGIPQVGFDIENNGCTAPCTVSFVNTSLHADRSEWTFREGSGPETSNEATPGPRTYSSAGKFPVRLVIQNAGGIEADTMRIVEILEDNTPFAGIEIKKTDSRTSPPFTYSFNSTSKNANQLRWEINKGNQLIKVASTKQFNLTLDQGTYMVQLAVSGTGGNDNAVSTLNVGRFWGQVAIPGEIRAFDPGIYNRILITRDSITRNN